MSIKRHHTARSSLSTNQPTSMFIYGKHITTANGANLDEIKSLLQKALRRKEAGYVRQAFQELTNARDLLNWKSLLTFLFEDHCLVDLKSLEQLYRAYQKRDKKGYLSILWKVRLIPDSQHCFI